MTHLEKAELLKNTIYHLYSKEGRSKSYISKLLDIDRKMLIRKIKEWDMPTAEPKRHLNPSNRKFANRNRTLIKSMLDKNISISQIAKRLNVTKDYLQKTIIPNDEVLNNAKKDYITRLHNKSEKKKESMKEKSSRKYITSYNDEIWKNILGYENYQVSNYGRIRKYVKSYDSYYEIQQTSNKNNNRLYVSIGHLEARKNLNVSRLVAHAFVNGYSKEKNTVNHKDGNIQNNKADNLEWLSQSENNKHSYEKLNRSKVYKKRYSFKYIIYNEKYRFKTVAALARFLNKSETQVRRYLDNPEKYNIQLIK